jgi:hypothetical protein
MKSIALIFIVGLLSNCVVIADEDHNPLIGIAPSSASVLASALEHADVAVARSVISTNELKGNFAEELSSRFILGSDSGPGKWHAISPRLGRQGLDHIAIRLDSEGHPRGLLVGETKYGTSQLGKTQTGVQMGQRYTSARLGGLASRLKDIHSGVEAGTTPEPRPVSLNKRYQVEIPLDEQTS